MGQAYESALTAIRHLFAALAEPMARLQLMEKFRDRPDGKGTDEEIRQFAEHLEEMANTIRGEWKSLGSIKASMASLPLADQLKTTEQLANALARQLGPISDDRKEFPTKTDLDELRDAVFAWNIFMKFWHSDSQSSISSN